MRPIEWSQASIVPPLYTQRVMRRRTAALGVVTSAAMFVLAACGHGPPASTPAPPRSSGGESLATGTAAPALSAIKHVFVIVLENESGSVAAKDPYLRQLAAQGASLTHYNGVGHPSQPNYVALLAGAPLVSDDGSHNLPQSNLVDLLESAGRSWKAYEEAFPGGCFAGPTAGDSTTGTYARKHDPFISFDDIRDVPGRCARIVPAAQLNEDISQGQLPDFSFYTPNQDDDGHDRSLQFASAWLKHFLETKLADAKFMDGTLVVVTFDEGNGDAASDPLYTVLLGPMVAPGSIDSAAYTHYSLLRTVEDVFGLGSLGREDAKARPFGACNFSGGC